MSNILVKPESTYINPYTDFGFKKLFGEEGSKDLLVDFLNQLLPAEYKIINLEFRDKELQPRYRSLEKPSLIYIARMNVKINLL